MEYLSFKITNYKGIADQEIRFDKSPHGSTFALVGLNESGKTTILEAISLLENREEQPESLYKENFRHIDANDMIPMKFKANFNGSINIGTTVRLSGSEMDEILEYAKNQLSFEIDRKSIRTIFSIRKELRFENSIYEGSMTYWDFSPTGRPLRGKKIRKLIRHSKEKWDDLIEEVRAKLPSILYFPTFLFEFPQRIYLADDKDESPTNAYYRLLGRVHTTATHRR